MKCSTSSLFWTIDHSNGQNHLPIRQWFLHKDVLLVSLFQFQTIKLRMCPMSLIQPHIERFALNHWQKDPKLQNTSFKLFFQDISECQAKWCSTCCSEWKTRFSWSTYLSFSSESCGRHCFIIYNQKKKKVEIECELPGRICA